MSELVSYTNKIALCRLLAEWLARAPLMVLQLLLWLTVSLCPGSACTVFPRLVRALRIDRALLETSGIQRALELSAQYN